MKNVLLILILLFPFLGNSQAFTEDFESGSGGYTLSQTDCNDGAEDYFTLTDGTTIGGAMNYGGATGSFFAAHDIDGAPCTTSPSTMTFTGINISGCTGLSMSVDLAEDDDGANQDWDSGDFVHFEVSIDGGAYAPVIWVENDGTGFNAEPLIDTDFDGNGDGAAITSTFQTFSNAIAGTGNSLDLRITFALDAGDEDIAIDNIIISGTGCSAVPSNTITTTGVTGNPWTVDCTTPDAGTVTFTSTGTYNAANIYTAQLSDPTGGFGSPISIGTLVSTANSGTINITIPAGTAAGTQYRIRVVSDDPVVTGADNGVDLTINNSTATGTIIINEMSNGPSGAQEYFEMLVIGAVCSEVSIRNIIFDDNNGDWGAIGVASGHYRFTTDAQWGCVPTGTIIVVYNDGDPNASVPADDEMDANADNVFILPVSSNLIETCTTDPNPGSAPYNVGGCTYSSGGTWTSLGMSNSGDVAQTRDAAGNFVHGIGYGGAVAPAGGVDFGALGGGGDVFIFDNSVDDDYTDPNNFSFGAVGTFESPGSPNSANNDTYIQSFDCVVLPVEMLYFNLRQNESNVDLYWATASESNNDYFAVERSVDGINYEQIGTVAGMGTTSSANSYNYRDESPKTGLNYYRIRQVDFNGESEYSGLRIANFKENNFSLINQYQSSDNTMNVIVKGMQKELDVQLYSVTGALMHSGISYSNSFDIPTANLSSGIYIMQLESGGQIIRKKLYILK